MSGPDDVRLRLPDRIAFNSEFLVESDLRIGGYLGPLELNWMELIFVRLIIIALFRLNSGKWSQITIDYYVH